jgi:hypothetical protein
MIMTRDDVNTARNAAYTAAWEQSQLLLEAIKDDLDYKQPPFEKITWAQLAYISRIVNLLRRTHTNPEDE